MSVKKFRIIEPIDEKYAFGIEHRTKSIIWMQIDLNY